MPRIKFIILLILIFLFLSSCQKRVKVAVIDIESIIEKDTRIENIRRHLLYLDKEIISIKKGELTYRLSNILNERNRLQKFATTIREKYLLDEIKEKEENFLKTTQEEINNKIKARYNELNKKLQEKLNNKKRKLDEEVNSFIKTIQEETSKKKFEINLRLKTLELTPEQIKELEKELKNLDKIKATKIREKKIAAKEGLDKFIKMEEEKINEELKSYREKLKKEAELELSKFREKLHKEYQMQKKIINKGLYKYDERNIRKLVKELQINDTEFYPYWMNTLVEKQLSEINQQILAEIKVNIGYLAEREGIELVLTDYLLNVSAVDFTKRVIELK